jgi:hypothetical protein
MAGRPGRCLSLIAVAALAALAGCGEEPVPEHPTWEPTMRQLFAAHCVRCHGLGGTLNRDPLVFGGTDSPARLYLDRFADEGDCTYDPVSMTVPASCRPGALSNAASIKLYAVTAKDTDGMRMPPAPSDPLSDWEKQLVARWCDDPRP